MVKRSTRPDPAEIFGRLRRTAGGLDLAVAWLSLPPDLRRSSRRLIEAAAAEDAEQPGRAYVTGGEGP